MRHSRFPQTEKEATVSWDAGPEHGILRDLHLGQRRRSARGHDGNKAVTVQAGSKSHRRRTPF